MVCHAAAHTLFHRRSVRRVLALALWGATAVPALAQYAPPPPPPSAMVPYAPPSAPCAVAPEPDRHGWPLPCDTAMAPQPYGAPGYPGSWIAPPGYYVAGITWVPVPVAGNPCQPCGESRTITTTRVVDVPVRTWHRPVRHAPYRDKRVKEKRIKE
jgi:hypothetical protein